MEKSKLYYLASLTSSNFKLMVEPCYKNDAKIDNHTLIYFIVSTLPNELSNPINFYFIVIVIEFYLAILSLV